MSDFAERPWIVIWETTRACDLTCAHCRAEAQPGRDPDELDDDEARRLMERVRRDFGPVLFVLTGGDPLKRQGLLDLVRHGHGIGLRMAITPSATPLLTDRAIRDLHAAGIRRLAISLDGATAPTHDAFRGIPGTFQRSLEALATAQAIGLPTQVNSSIGHANLHELDALAELGRWYGIALWSVFILVPTGRAGSDMLMTAREHERVYLRLAKLALDPGTPYDIKTTAGQPYYRVRSQLRRSRGLEPLSTVTAGHGGATRAPGGVNDGKGFCFVSHTGDIQPSGFLPLTCGNVRSDDLATIYRHHALFRELRDVDGYHGKCGVCDFRHLCGGSRSRSWALTGDHLASDPTCCYQPPALTAAAS